MGSSTSKGNISVFLLVIALLVIVVLVVLLAELMISNGVRSGKYSNPIVATHVVRGTIYDRNGRVLAMEVPQTTVLVKKDSRNIETISQILAIATDSTPGTILSLCYRRPAQSQLPSAALVRGSDVHGHDRRCHHLSRTIPPGRKALP